MDQRTRNLKLLGIFGILVLATTLLYFIPKNKKSSIKDTGLFQIADTSSIDKITIKSRKLDNILQRTDTGWIVNNRIKADENIMMVLLTVMRQVEILRPVPSGQTEEIKDVFNENAIEINFLSDGDTVKSFVASANETKTVSIFKADGEKYFVVTIPGYDSFVSGIFEISEIDWKDRLIVDATPTSLNQLKVKYVESERKGFTVEVVSNFPSIGGVENLDTLKLMDYLDQFQYFQADRFADLGRETQYDSLINTSPYASFYFDNIGKINDVEITFYHQIPGDNLILAVTGEGEPALFSYRRISAIFREKEFFVKK